MFCPNCQSEYVPGIDRCEACGEPLTPSAARAEAEESSELVPLREITDPDELPIYKSVLEAAGIPYVIQGEEIQGLFPLPAAGANLHPPSLGAIIQVPRDRFDEARELLENSAVPQEPGLDESS